MAKKSKKIEKNDTNPKKSVKRKANRVSKPSNPQKKTSKPNEKTKKPRKSTPSIKGKMPTSALKGTRGKNTDDLSLKKGSNRVSKRKAKRTFVNKPIGVVKRTRKQSSYDILQSAVSQYCKDRYARLMASNELSAEQKKKIRKTCTKAEIKEIYNSLKGRFLKDAKGIKGRSKDVISPSEIASKIDSILGYYGASDIPLQLREPIEWYYIIDYLLNNDGLFFKDDDIMIFNCSTLDLSLGQYEVFYKDVDTELGDTMYVDLRQFIDENPEYDNSPIPEFVLNEEMSDIENRTFVWDLVVLDSFIDRKEERGSVGERESGTDDFDLSEEDLADVRKEVEEIKEGVGDMGEVDMSSDSLLELERERTRQKESELAIEVERRKTEEARGRNLELEIAREKQKAANEKELMLLRMLESGKITFEQYLQLKG